MKKTSLAVLVALLAAGCVGRFDSETVAKRDSGTAANPVVDEGFVPPMDPNRKVSEQDCSRPVTTGGGNLMCREVSEAERRARIEEEERQARARKEAEERAARERRAKIEADARAKQLALEEAARKARAAEEERLAAERRRLEEEAARKAREAREAEERAAAAALARQRAEQEAREAAERECRRLEQERLDGRAILEGFVANYGAVDEYKQIAGQISTFLNRPRKPKPCP